MIHPLSICFSPTGGGEKISQAILSGLGSSNGVFNVAYTALPESAGENDAPVVFTIPVYGGHMPKIAKERFDVMCGNGNRPAILVAVYGNRAFEKALTDLEAYVRERGFRPIAAAAFACEHSYSSAETPIAQGRPDADDLSAAREFGRMAGEKLLSGTANEIVCAQLEDEASPQRSLENFISFVKGYQARQSESPRVFLPSTVSEKCAECGECAASCPTGAIGPDITTDASRCIKCCACVKICPTGARVFESPFARILSENFAVRKSPRWIL